MPTRSGTRSRRTARPPAAVTGRLIAAQEEERRRITRELHDDICQRLSLLAMELDRLALGPHDERTPRRARDLARLAGEIAGDVHRIAYRLHPAKLETLGLVVAIGSLCQELWSQDGLRVQFTHSRVPRAVPSDVALCLYRIAQEALHNVIKHSGVREADVHLTGEGHDLLLRIADAGTGFAATDPAAIGIGLTSMQERVESLGGRLIVHAAPGRGTRIVAKIDLVAPGKDAAP